MRIALPESISSKLFFSFFAMSVITGALGVWGVNAITAAGHIVVETYDKPLMSINFARSAGSTFLQMENRALRARLGDQPIANADDMSTLEASFSDNLNIAEQRSLSSRSRQRIQAIRAQIDRWAQLRQAGQSNSAAFDALSPAITTAFDDLTEQMAEDAFLERQKAVSAIATTRDVGIAATALAFLLSGVITLVLGRRIVRPLSAAAAVANRIANGELETAIPLGGKDETGTLLRSMTVMQDSIRAMMEREAAQRRSAQGRLVDALESTREAMLLLDETGRVVIANTQIGRFFPLLAHELAEDTLFADGLLPFSPAELGIIIEPGSQPGLAELLTTPGEIRLTDDRWLRISSTALRDGGTFLFWSDITELKEREEGYRIAKYQAELASTAKSHFLATMSHELRTPLNAIIGFSEIIVGELFGKLGNPSYRDYAGNILLSGQRLLEIINGVLDLADSESGKLVLRPEPLKPRRLMTECAGAVAADCARGQLDIAVEVPHDLPPVWADRTKLRQVLRNLLSNAVKFSPAGGRITLSASPAPGALVELRVTDTGIGMRPEDIPVALSLFGQIEGNFNRQYEGCGVGLPLAKALIQMHGGRIAISSTPGSGTTVSIFLLDADAITEEALAGHMMNTAA
ncbi:MAG TPA: ATP-binding protein [Stellaceae bacterium]|nr:ATP-binding protein [Stellaceae bacterium]